MIHPKPRWEEVYTYTGTGTCPRCGERGSILHLRFLGRCENCLPPIVLGQLNYFWEEAMDMEERIKRIKLLREWFYEQIGDCS